MAQTWGKGQMTNQVERIAQFKCVCIQHTDVGPADKCIVTYRIDLGGYAESVGYVCGREMEQGVSAFAVNDPIDRFIIRVTGIHLIGGEMHIEIKWREIFAHPRVLGDEKGGKGGVDENQRFNVQLRIR